MSIPTPTLGFSFVLEHRVVVRGIGVVGGFLLVWFGTSIIRDVVRGRIPTDFLRSAVAGHRAGGQGRNTPGPVASSGPRGGQGLENPVLGGALVSMANPYWWVWWATIGFAFLVQFDISFDTWPRLLAFFLGHEAGDLLWYVLVSCLSFFGLQHLNRRAYYGILGVCAAFMILFGVYLGVWPFLRT